jgi:hypothetical protein
MKRSLLNLWVDCLAAVFLLVMVATGYILRFPLPPGTNRTQELWGLSRHDWGTVHTWTSFGLLAVLATHLFLHWPWIISMISPSSGDGTRLRSRPAGMIAILILFIAGGSFAWLAQVSVRERKTPLHPLDQSSISNGTAGKTESFSSTVSFIDDIQPIFKASCMGCHGPERMQGRFRVDRREDFFSAQNGPPLILPGNPGGSRFLEIVSGRIKNMKSADLHQLNPAEIEKIRAWIASGAPWEEP